MGFVFKRRRARSGGRVVESSHWYGEFTDHASIVQRLRLFKDKTVSEGMLRRLEALAACRAAGEMPSMELTAWVNQLSSEFKRKLADMRLLTESQTAGFRPLAAHLDDWSTALRQKERSPRYIEEVHRNVARLVADNQWHVLADIKLSGFQDWSRLRRERDSMSASTVNTYGKDLRSFCGWLVKTGRLASSPLTGLEFLNEQKDRRRMRRALDVEAFRRLLATTEARPVNFGMRGAERMLLYWLAAETGLRWSELESLRPDSFQIGEDLAHPFVRLMAKDAKNGLDAEQPVTPELAVRLRKHFATQEPTAAAFTMPAERRGARMLKADLEAAGIPYLDRGKYFDFHALRGMCATLLARANTPLTLAQRILRHSTPDLTSNFYTLYELEHKSEALARVPSLAPDAKPAEFVPASGTANAAPPATSPAEPSDR